jgi:hypothetical protein
MKLVAGAILVLAGAVLVSAAMVGVDIRNSTGYAPYAESRLGYYLGAAAALAGGVLMALGAWRDRGGRGGID